MEMLLPPRVLSSFRVCVCEPGAMDAEVDLGTVDSEKLHLPQEGHWVLKCSSIFHCKIHFDSLCVHTLCMSKRRASHTSEIAFLFVW